MKYFSCTNQIMKKAFTLIELLVVISIISLLIAILLPALQNARKTSRAIVCANNVRTLQLAQILYSDDFNAYAYLTRTGTPPINFLQKEFYLGKTKALDTWLTPVGQPVNKSPYICPEEPAAIKTAGGGAYTGVALPYGWNMVLGGFNYSPSIIYPPRYPFVSPSAMKSPSTLAGWADMVKAGAFYPPDDGWYYPVKQVRVYTGRHGGRKNLFANASFLDGHVSNLHEDQISDANNAIYKPK